MAFIDQIGWYTLKILADFECKLFVHFQVNRLFFRKIKVSHFAILNLVNIIAIPGKNKYRPPISAKKLSRYVSWCMGRSTHAVLSNDVSKCWKYFECLRHYLHGLLS